MPRRTPRQNNPRNAWVVIAPTNKWQWPVAPVEVVTRFEAIDRTQGRDRAEAIKGFSTKKDAEVYAEDLRTTEVLIEDPQGNVVYEGPLLGFSETDRASRQAFVDRGRLLALVEQNEVQLGRGKKSLMARRLHPVTEYRVMYLGEGALPMAVEGTFALDEAQRGLRSLKRRGLTVWVETEDGEFVPVKGAMRKPKSRVSNASALIQLVDEDTGEVEWTGTPAAFIESQDPEVWSAAQLQAIARLGTPGGPDGYYFGGGASPYMLIRREGGGRDYRPLDAVAGSRTNRLANALTRGEV